VAEAELQEAPVGVHATAAAVAEAELQEAPVGVHATAAAVAVAEAADVKAEEEAEAGADVKAAAERSRSHQNRTQRAILPNPQGVLAPLEAGPSGAPTTRTPRYRAPSSLPSS
jgi:hypothetical protein